MNKIPIFIFGLAMLTLRLPASHHRLTHPKGLPPQAAIVRGVLVPVPREIFLALDRFAHSNWRKVQRPELAQWRPPGDQVRNALLLGALIAEGFVAVEAEDSAETKDIGRAVRTLARGLESKGPHSGAVAASSITRIAATGPLSERMGWSASRR